MRKVKVYLDAGATSTKPFKKINICDFYHFPYNSGDRSKDPHIQLAMPSEALYKDGNITWAEARWPWANFSGSHLLCPLINLLQTNTKKPKNLIRRDALHLDSAYKIGCSIFITSDKKDIASTQSRNLQINGH